MSGETVVVGYTNSDNFSAWTMTNAFTGATDGFVAEVGNDGSAILLSYLGGTYYAYANAVALEQNTGQHLVTGETSPKLPTSPGHSGTQPRGSDAFITGLWSNLAMNASTYLGGSEMTEEQNNLTRQLSVCPRIYHSPSPHQPLPVTPNPNIADIVWRWGVDAFITKMARTSHGSAIRLISEEMMTRHTGLPLMPTGLLT
jgi:hypothetical protein